MTPIPDTSVTREASRNAALEAIRELASRGHALSYIAKGLTLRGIPTPAGGARWHHHMVARIAAAHGVAVGYRRV